MGTHHIHGTEVDFHSDTESAKDFLKNNGHAAKNYFEHAKNKGEAIFYDGEGNKFKIEHKEEDEKDSFSIHRHS